MISFSTGSLYFACLIVIAPLLLRYRSRFRGIIFLVLNVSVMVLTSLGSAAVFCNQIMPIILSHTLLAPIYEKRGYSAEQLAMDMENICITVPAFVPWAIICSVPLRLLGADYRSMLLAVFLYAVPIFNGLARYRQYRNIDRAAPDAEAQGDPKE